MSTTKTEAVIVALMAAAGANQAVSTIWPYPGKWLIDTTKTGIVGAAVTQDATNVTLIALTNVTASKTYVSHDTTTGQGGTLVVDALTATGLSLLTGTGLIVTQGDVIKLAKTDGGTGKAWAGTGVITAKHVQG